MNLALSCSLQGEWKCDEPEGRGKFEYADGDVYEGDWKEGEREGHGIKTYASGGATHRTEGGGWGGEHHLVSSHCPGVYDGEWRQDLRNGRGTYKMKNGTSMVSWYRGGVVADGVGWSADRKKEARRSENQSRPFAGLQGLLKHL